MLKELSTTRTETLSMKEGGRMVNIMDREHTTKVGDKYTGQWDDNKGQGEIKYKDGKKYIKSISFVSPFYLTLT